MIKRPAWLISRVFTKEKDDYNVALILTDVLEEVTGQKGTYTIRNTFGRKDIKLAGYSFKAIYCTNYRARKIWQQIYRSPELQALVRITYPGGDEPTFDECFDWSAQTQRRLAALYWMRRAEEWDDLSEWSYVKNLAEEARTKARQLLPWQMLPGTIDYPACNYTHKIEGVTLPTAADFSDLIQDVVTKYLANFYSKIIEQEK